MKHCDSNDLFKKSNYQKIIELQTKLVDLEAECNKRIAEMKELLYEIQKEITGFYPMLNPIIDPSVIPSITPDDVPYNPVVTVYSCPSGRPVNFPNVFTTSINIGEENEKEI